MTSWWCDLSRAQFQQRVGEETRRMAAESLPKVLHVKLAKDQHGNVALFRFNRLERWRRRHKDGTR